MKKAITVIIIIMFILIIALICLLTYKLLNNEKQDIANLQENKQNNIQNEENQNTQSNEAENKVERVTNRDMFYTVSYCVEKYLNYVTAGDDEVVYNLLSSEYKEEHNITKDNLWNYVKQPKERQIFTAKVMYKQEKYRNNKYHVYGTIRDDLEETDYKETKFNVTVIVDSINQTFSIIPEAPNIDEFENV